MLHDDIINESLSLYTKGQAKVRKSRDYTENKDLVLPTFNDIVAHLERKNIATSHIMATRHMVETGSIPERIDSLRNIHGDFGWLNNDLESLLMALAKIPKVFNQAIDAYEAKEAEYGLDFTKDITNLVNVRENFLKSADYKNIVNHIEERIEFNKETKNIIEEVLQNEILYFRVPTNKELDTNPLFSKMNERLQLMMEKYPSYKSLIEPTVDITPILKYIHSATSYSMNMFKALREKGEKTTFAEKYVDIMSRKGTEENPLLNFLNKKLDDETNPNNPFLEHGVAYQTTLELGKYKNLFVFNDSSVLIQKRSGEFVEILDNKAISDLLDELIRESIRHEFNKNPQIAKQFIQMAGTHCSYFKVLTNLMETYKNNTAIIKSNNIDLLKLYKEQSNTGIDNRRIEAVDDYLHKVIKEHKVKQLAHSISSNKYNHLYNDESYKLIENIYDLNLKKEVFQNYIGRKIAAYKTPEDFNNALEKFYISFTDFSASAIVRKADNLDVRVVHYDDDLVILGIKNYEESKQLGSSSWCIVRDEEYFESYAGGKNDKQYFLFDFTKEAKDNASTIGITLKKGIYSAAHYKNDDHIDEDNEDLLNFIEIINDAEYLLESKNEVKRSIKNEM